MTVMRTEELKDLLRHKGICVSIFMPTHRRGAEVQQDAIRLKNLLRKAEEQLEGQPLRRAEIAKLLAPAKKLVADTHFWNHQRDGLALFLSQDLSRHVPFPEPFDELVVVTERFHMKPLLPLLNGDGRFYILAASKKRLRFFEGTRDSVREVDLEDVPKSLAEVLKRERAEKQLQFRTQIPQGRGGRGAIFHGHGGGTDDAEEKKETVRYFQKVDEGIRDFLKGGHPPLVFAGVDSLLSLYREASSYPDLVAEGISGNPDELSAAELHERAWKRVDPHFRKEQEDAAAQYRQWAGTGRTTNRIDEAVRAGWQGRVDVLFVSLGSRTWGSVDEGGGEVEIHEERRPGDEDLIDRAALETILNGGTVYAVKPEAMPAASPLAALFRY